MWGYPTGNSRVCRVPHSAFLSDTITLAFKFQFIELMACYFLVSEQESNQRSRPGRGITGKCRNSRALAGGNRTIISAFARSAPVLGFFWPFSCRNKKRANSHRNDKLKFEWTAMLIYIIELCKHLFEINVIFLLFLRPYAKIFSTLFC